VTREQEEIRVAVDGPFGAYADDSERRGPEKGQEPDRQDTSRAADTQPAEVRSRAEYYEVLHARDQQMTGSDRAETASSTTRTRSAWNTEAVEDHPDPPSLDSLRTTPERTKHILDGDNWGGGHRHGTGRPGKTEFPAGWDDDKIMGNVREVARAPDDLAVFQPNHRWRVHGQRDDVGITVIVLPDGRICSAWPDADSPGVVKNPKEKP
jgi:Bacterial EndoU nuclease